MEQMTIFLVTSGVGRLRDQQPPEAQLATGIPMLSD